MGRTTCMLVAHLPGISHIKEEGHGRHPATLHSHKQCRLLPPIPELHVRITTARHTLHHHIPVKNSAAVVCTVQNHKNTCIGGRLHETASRKVESHHSNKGTEEAGILPEFSHVVGLIYVVEEFQEARIRPYRRVYIIDQ